MVSAKATGATIVGFFGITMLILLIFSSLIPQVTILNLELFFLNIGNWQLTTVSYIIIVIAIIFFFLAIFLGFFKQKFGYIIGAITGILIGMIIFACITALHFNIFISIYL